MEPVALPNIGKPIKKKKKLCQGLYKNTIRSYTLKILFYNYSISLWLITDFFYSGITGMHVVVPNVKEQMLQRGLTLLSLGSS